jgi:hypothetical protein
MRCQPVADECLISGFIGCRLDAVFDYGARRDQQLFTPVNDKKSRVD